MTNPEPPKTYPEWTDTRTEAVTAEHNPDRLTPEQYGAPEWRLLKKGERTTQDDEWFDPKLERWFLAQWRGLVPAPCDTYRRRRVTADPAPCSVTSSAG